MQDTLVRTEDAPAAGDVLPAKHRPARKWVVGTTCVLATLGFLAFLFPIPVVLLTPGPATDLGSHFQITGAPVTEIRGRYLSTSVYVQSPSAYSLVRGLMNGGSIEPAEASAPDDGSFFDVARADSANSQTFAAVAAARALGMPVTVNGTGARVELVLHGSPAKGVLRRGDVIVGVDGKPVMLVSDVTQAVRSRPIGTSIPMTIERAGERRDVVVRSWQRPRDPSQTPRVGAVLKTRNLDLAVPFTIKFRNTGEDYGPSAGLAYALAIADALSADDLAAGRTIAATGEIDPIGAVDLVGGVAQKSAGAAAQGARVLVVPRGLEDDAARDGVRVLAASTIEDALTALREAA